MGIESINKQVEPVENGSNWQSLEPGKMVYSANLGGEERHFAQVYQTSDGGFAVLTDWPENNGMRPEELRYDPEIAAQSQRVFDTLEEANQALVDYAEEHGLARAGQGYDEYPDFAAGA
jgi:hypothetical protein